MSLISLANSRIDLLSSEKPDQVQEVQQTDGSGSPTIHNRAASSAPATTSSSLTSTYTTSPFSSHSPPIISAVMPLATAQAIDKSPEQLFVFIATATDTDFDDFINKPGSLWLLARKNTVGQNVMHLAASKKHPEVIEKLLKLSISKELILAQDIVGSIPLMIAAEYGHADVVRSLLSRRSIKAQLNAVTMYGDTALMTATASGHMEIVRLLLDAGSSLNQINAVNHAGCNAVGIAYQRGHLIIAALFELYG